MILLHNAPVIRKVKISTLKERLSDLSLILRVLQTLLDDVITCNTQLYMCIMGN